ncbi:MAG: chemotaxis protein CheD [Gemmatimonadota bacterium]|nr:chemotaxis protein CheD [Gemmatimonadota bacterium]MDH5759999.1 chemotaxis protein CheD [Gemmatimonadota bacterium]
MTLPAMQDQGSKIVVGIADLRVSNDPADTIVTYALGSCLGVCIWDESAGVAGMLHAMLPSTRTDPERGRTNPARFIDTGIPALFKAAYAMGAHKDRIVVRVAGGASMASNGRKDGFQIGKRNYIELKKILWRNGVIITDEDVGGGVSRTVTMDVATGVVMVKAGGQEYNLARRFPRRS